MKAKPDQENVVKYIQGGQQYYYEVIVILSDAKKKTFLLSKSEFIR